MILLAFQKACLISYEATPKGRKVVKFTNTCIKFCEELFTVLHILNYEKIWDLE